MEYRIGMVIKSTTHHVIWKIVENGAVCIEKGKTPYRKGEFVSMRDMESYEEFFSDMINWEVIPQFNDYVELTK